MIRILAATLFATVTAFTHAEDERNEAHRVTTHEAKNQSHCQTGPGYFDYTPHRENVEAEQLAMHLAGQLRAPDEEYARILRDLQLIRDAYSEIAFVIDRPDYGPDELLVRLIKGEPENDYDALNAYYQVVEDRTISQSLNIHLLTFCGNLNIPLLVPIYVAPNILYAGAAWSVLGGDEITVERLDTVHRYTISTGCGDCLSGCIYWRSWTIDVDEKGNLTLVSLVGSDASCFVDCCVPDGRCLNLSETNCARAEGSLPPACLGDSNGDGFDDACGCPAVPPPNPDVLSGGAGSLTPNIKNRFLSFSVDPLSWPTAIRVTFVDLPQPFEAFNGTTMWLSEPQPTCENSGQGRETPIDNCGPAPGLASRVFQTVQLTCDRALAYYTDWSAVGKIHVFHNAVVSGGIYEVQLISELCTDPVEDQFSEPLTISTAVWGDVVRDVTGCPNGASNGTIDVLGDVVSLINKFSNLNCAPSKSRADLEPGSIDLKINFTDVLQSVRAFQGATYPFTPTTAPCPATPPGR